MGLNQACYFAGTDKIYATMENYIVKFNATTGAREAYAKVAAPLYGPMTCCAGSTAVYCGLVHDYSWVNDTLPGVANKFIWTVNPITLVATDSFALNAFFEAYWSTASDSYSHEGVLEMKEFGAYLYFEGSRGGGSTPGRVKLTDPTDNTLDDFGDPWGDAGFRPEACDVGNYGGNDRMFHIDMGGPEWESRTIIPGVLGPFVSPWDIIGQTGYGTTPDYPAALVFYAPSTAVYIVCGNGNMYKRNASTGALIGVMNLDAVFANVKPFRIRLSPINGLIYIPCQDMNVVIIWDPLTDTGIYRDGFHSPIDIVFTGTKAWAVQSGVTPLQEIVI